MSEAGSRLASTTHGRRPLSPRRARMLTLAEPLVSLCDGHTKPAAGLTESTLTSPVPRTTRMSFERAPNATSRADQTTVRRANLGVVLQQIAGGEPRSRARVAAETGLTRGTVSSLVGELIELDLLRETGEDERSGRVGRPAQTLELGDRVVAIGLEVNVDYLAVCVEDLTGDGPLRAARAHATTGARARARARPACRGWREEALDAIAADGSRRRRCRGRAARASSRRRRARCSARRTSAGPRSPLPTSSPLGSAGLPVRADNEANLAALAEHWQGVARDRRELHLRLRRGRASAAGSSSTASSSAVPTATAASSATSRSTRTGRRASAARPAASRRSSGRRRSRERAGLSVGAGGRARSITDGARATRGDGRPGRAREPRGGRAATSASGSRRR